jgi:restriction system protein
MSIPDFQSMMLPVLKALGSEPQSIGAIRDTIAREYQLSDADRSELLPSGRQGRFNNRVAWALGYLKQALLLTKPRRGFYQAPERGRDVLARQPGRIDIAYLTQFPEFQEFRSRSRSTVDERADVIPTDAKEELKATLTPDEQVREGYRTLRTNLATELLSRIQAASPAFFETLVVDLLVAMGYGGSQEDAASVVGRSGDEGIDGIIKEDKLGLDNIYLQAKRWKESRTVGRPDVQQFAGALQGQRARKGVFITTSTFSRDAVQYAKSLQTTIVLVDGTQLAQLLLDHRVGVSVQETIHLLKIDEDYFEAE